MTSYPMFTCITGSRRSGKTTLGQALVDRMTANVLPDSVIFVDEDRVYTEAHLDRLVQRFATAHHVVLVGEHVQLLKRYHEKFGGPFPRVYKITTDTGIVLGS